MRGDVLAASGFDEGAGGRGDVPSSIRLAVSMHLSACRRKQFAEPLLLPPPSVAQRKDVLQQSGASQASAGISQRSFDERIAEYYDLTS